MCTLDIQRLPAGAYPSALCSSWEGLDRPWHAPMCHLQGESVLQDCNSKQPSVCCLSLLCSATADQYKHLRCWQSARSNGRYCRASRRAELASTARGMQAACRPVLHLAGDQDRKMRASRLALVALQTAICAFKAGSRCPLPRSPSPCFHWQALLAGFDGSGTSSNVR